MSLKKRIVKEIDKNLARKRKSKIELAGPDVMKFIMKLAKDTDMTCTSIATATNKEFSHLDLNLIPQDISRFFKRNGEAISELMQERNALAAFRQKYLLNHRAVLTKDIRHLEKEIEKIIGPDGDLMDPSKRAKAIVSLIDQKGKLLIRDAKLSGKLTESGNINAVQVNISQQVHQQKSEIIKKLKSFDNKKDKEVIIEKNE